MKQRIQDASAGPSAGLRGRIKGYGHTFCRDFRRDWQLHLLMLIPVLYVLLFYYGPMYGVQIAFRDFRVADGITGSEWVGWKWFEKFTGSYNFKQVFANTLVLSLYELAVSFPLPIILALLLNTLKNGRFKTITQTISYLPHFLSVVILVSIFQQIFSPINGLYGTIYRLLGGNGYPKDFRGAADTFRHIYVWTGVWQQLGWNAIIYTAALSGVSNDQHEAALIDGASRWQRVLHVDLPAIMPTICIMLILRCGSILGIGFTKAYLLQTSMNTPTSEIISTYIYKVGMGSSKDFSYGAAVGLFNSVINCIMLVLANFITKKLGDDEVSLF